MWAIPNTTVTLLESSGVDEWTGLGTESVAASGVSASIIEQTRLVDDPVTGTPRVVRAVTGRVPDGTTVTRSHRVRDEVSSATYAVHSVRQHTNPFYTSDVTLDLVRTDSTDP